MTMRKIIIVGIVLVVSLSLISCTEMKAGILVVRADSAINNGSFEKAEDFYKEIIALQPDVPEHHWKLGTIYISQNRTSEVEGQIRKLRKMKRNDLADQLVRFLRAQPQ